MSKTTKKLKIISESRDPIFIDESGAIDVNYTKKFVINTLGISRRLMSMYHNL